MDIRDAVFGSGRSGADMRGVFAPAGAAAAPDKGSVLATFKGFGKEGKGRDWVLNGFEKVGLINAEQRIAGGPVAGAAGGAASVSASGAFAGDAAVAGAANVMPPGTGLYEQILMRDLGYVPQAAASAAMPDESVAAAAASAADVIDAVDAPVAAASDDLAAHAAKLEQQLLGSFQRLGALPDDLKVSTLARAVDAGAAAGHGDDAFGLLASALASRPLEHSISALDTAIDDAARVLPAAAKLAAEMPAAAAAAAAAHGAPAVDDVVRASASAAPKLVKTIAPKFADDAVHGLAGLMSFSAGIDDTLRLLARF